MTPGDDTQQMPTEKLTIRQLMEHPTLGWRPVSDARSAAIFRGEKAIPECANKTIRMVMAVLAVEGQGKSLRRLEITYLKFLGDGHADRKAFMGGIIEKFSKNSDERCSNGDDDQDSLTSSDTDSILQALGLS